MLAAARLLAMPVVFALLLFPRPVLRAIPNGLPLGDGKLTTGPRVGYLWACRRPPGGGGAQHDGAWIGAGTWDPAKKLSVGGEVSWPSQFVVERAGSFRTATGNGLPAHPTGTFPIRGGDPAYQYDRNPNPIRAQQLQMRVPDAPTLADRPSCLPMGPIGVMLTGAAIFDAIDLLGRDAAAHEIQDRCGGHPERNGQYHYHSLSPCAGDAGAGHSPLVGYALDGFGIYGKRGEGGQKLTNADLDECHGHSHVVGSAAVYHYHATDEFPYTLGCFRGVR